MATLVNQNYLIPFLFFLPIANSLHFKLSRFNSHVNTILLEGDAVFSKGNIELNTLKYTTQVGRASYIEKVHLWDSATGKLSDFTTHFSFTINTRGKPSYGHGLAFFLAPVGSHIPPNSVHGFLGLYNRTTIDFGSKNQIVHVEFDSYVNKWDPRFEHVGININSISSATSAVWSASLNSGNTSNAWITYNATTKDLSVFWTYENDTIYRGNSIISYKTDLMQVLPEWVMIGFSASTGHAEELHTLQSWEFSSSLEITQENKSTKKSTNISLVVKLSIAGALLICIFVMVLVWMVISKKRRARKEEETVVLTSINGDFERGAGPKRFTLRELISATNNFSDERKLGQGGFGGVFRGFLSDLELAVAVKKISRGSRQGKKEYITEVKTISRLRHRNLVQLVGWCHERSEFLLVYELMPNGSLDSHLFGRRSPLTWDIRYKIALGLASALLYLHEEWEQCVVHRDVKSSNVMLDSNFNAKLGDFGLARLMDHELGPQTTGLAGTFGYLAPEYINTGKASKESDVFSFGVVALEIVCGRKSITRMEEEETQVGLVEWAWDHSGRGKISEVVDKRLNMEFDEKQVACLVSVGLWCAHPDHTLRPSISQAIQVLKMETTVPDLPPKMPVPLYHVPELAVSSSEPPSLTCTSLEMGR